MAKNFIYKRTQEGAGLASGVLSSLALFGKFYHPSRMSDSKVLSLAISAGAMALLAIVSVAIMSYLKDKNGDSDQAQKHKDTLYAGIGMFFATFLTGALLVPLAIGKIRSGIGQ